MEEMAAAINEPIAFVREKNSVGRALDCRAGGPGFDSRGQTKTQGLKMTEN